MVRRPNAKGALHLSLLALGALVACSSDPQEGLDVTIFDAGTSFDLDGSTEQDAALDVGSDSGVDSGADAADAADDGGTSDAGDDAEPVDGDGTDATDATDAEAIDADPDAGSDAAADAEVDGGFDAGGPGPAPTGYFGTAIDETLLGGRGITVVDIEGDNDLDVIASYSLADAVRLYLNDGSATFTPIDLGAPGTIVAMAQVVADFDDDGDLDVAAVSSFNRSVGPNTPGDIVWYQSPGAPNGTWATLPVSLGALYGLDTIATADFTGDGRPDLVVGCNEAYDTMGNVVGHGVFWIPSTGAGTFGAPTAIDEFLGGVELVTVTDVDLDGVPDVIASSRNDSELVWFENLRAPGTIDPLPTFARHTIANPNLPTAIALGQLDLDPALELVSIEDDTLGGRLVWFDPPADPTQPWALTEIDPAFGGSGLPIRVVTTDLNQDGYTDVAVASAVHDQVRAYIQQALGAWTQQAVEPALDGVGAIGAGDLDGDLYPDLVTDTNGLDPTFDRIGWWRTQP